MNIYKLLNEVVFYIEDNLDKEIDSKKLARIAGLTVQSLQNVFALITNVGLAEYIRNRRLSCAAEDLISGLSVMEVALKYQYTSAVAFSRSFTRFHHIKPSALKKGNHSFISYPILNFDEDNKSIMDMSYRIEKRKAFDLFGVKKETDEENISYDAPRFFSETKRKYKDLYGDIPYGMVLYEKRFSSEKLEYWCLYSVEHEGFSKVSFPDSKWLIFKIRSQEARDIQNLSHKFYDTFFPKNKFQLRDLPELEVYKEDYTEFMIAIL